MLKIDLGDGVEGTLRFERVPSGPVTAEAQLGPTVVPLDVQPTSDPLVYLFEFVPAEAGRWVIVASAEGQKPSTAKAYLKVDAD